MAGFDASQNTLWDDDELDAIPLNDLDLLEQDAISFTQHQTQTKPKTATSSDYGDEFEDDDLEDAVVYDEACGIPPQLQSLTANKPGTSTQREIFRVQRYGGASNVNDIPNRPIQEQWQARPQPPYSQVSRKDARISSVANTPAHPPVSTQVPDVDALQKQVQDLLRAQQQLKQELSVKSGENAIIRSKQQKQAKEHERELTAVRKQNAERVANQQKAIEVAREAEKKRATELEFAKKDLFEEAEKVRNLKRSKPREGPTTAETVTTPKRNKSALHRDGFDDDEVQLISPSKFQGRRSNGGTPTKAGAKRKRKPLDSPIASLKLEQEESTETKPQPTNVILLDGALIEKLRRVDHRLDFLQAMLDHQPKLGALRTIEAFAKIYFPDSPADSFASMIFAKLPSMKQSTSELPIEFCELIISLWLKCLHIKFYTPIPLLIDLLSFALELKTLAIAPFIMYTLLPVAQSTVDLVGIPRFKRAKYDEFKKDIDVSACLDLIELVAQGCIHILEHNVQFWRLMRLDFVLMLLSQHQPVRDFTSMLRLLAMSVTQGSIGPKPSDQDTQPDQLRYIIDRMSLLLVMIPTVEAGQEKYEPSEIAHLRLQILRTFEAFCQVPWCGEVIAKHRWAIGRLAKVMSDELDTLYDYRIDNEQSARLICLSTRILHYLVTKHDQIIQMQEKLSVVHGGNQKYLISLARLHYAENDLLLEALISPEVSECAQEMLELAVTPEEGEAIHAVFSGG